MSLTPPITFPASLDEVKIKGLLNSAFYISSFISVEEEEYLISKISSQPISTWRKLSHRRLQVYPSVLTPKGELSKGSLPSWLEEPLISRLLNLKLASHDDHTQGVFGNSPHQRPNHVLINEYPPGIGIFPHEDGPAYFPAVATISLGGHTVLDVYRKDAIGQREMQPTWRILQERRSLLITMGDLYRETLHGIGDLVSDDNLGSGRIDNWEMLRDDTRSACVSNNGALERRLRISATIRDVIQVRDYSKLLSGRGGKRM